MKTRKRTAILSVLAMTAILTVAVFSGGCGEYGGKPISKIVYESVDYMGGFTDIYVVDFQSNSCLTAYYNPMKDESKPEPEFFRAFVADQGRHFLDSINKGGLLTLWKKYEMKGVMDGFGWTLTIFYEDGTTKVSTGSNYRPKAFDRCAPAFESLFGMKVM